MTAAPLTILLPRHGLSYRLSSARLPGLDDRVSG